MKELEYIFSKLGLNKDNGLILTKGGHWKKDTSFPNRVKRLIELKIRPDAFFCFDNKPMILFFYNPTNIRELHEAVWNFNECPIVIIVQNDVIDIFNGFNYFGNLKALERLGGVEKLTDFTYLEMVSGKTWEQYVDQLNYKNRVDYHLLQNIKAARKVLVEKHKLNAKISNSIIGKCIFVRYLIDRKVKIKFDGKLRTWTNDEFCDLLTRPKEAKQFFDYLEDNERGFNGDLFPLNIEEYGKISDEDYLVIKRLLRGDDIEQNQPSLFEFYNFSIIPIEFISNVYELFIGQENQKQEGAYYTPLFLVDYILKETVESHLINSEKLDESVKEVLLCKNGSYSYCRVFDPACGSGIFLVETLRKIIEQYINDTGIEIKSEGFRIALRNLASENIYGIDKDLSAVQVAIFSIYLTMLDYLEPPSIESFKFPTLFNTNFFEADFFDEKAKFNDQFKNIEFDFVLGNPPWNRGKGEKIKPSYVEYIDKRRKIEKAVESPQLEIGNREIAQAFLLRCSDFSKEKTKSALIVTSKTLYNVQSISFRKYFLHNFFIEQVFELAPVRREVFDKSNDKAIAPACVLFFKYANGSSTDSNTVTHISLKPSRFFSMFKIFTINRTDFKTILQNKLKENDWVWKVLVYGSYLDFNFLKRLKDDYSSISSFLTENNVLIKQGIKRKDGVRKINTNEIVGWDFLDLNKKEIQQLFITQKHQKWQETEVGYIYRENGRICTKIFSPPMLLVKETVNTKLESVAAISSKRLLFTDKITSIRMLQSENTKYYYLLAGLMNSTLFAYYILNTSSTAGIMIEQQINDSERFAFPFIHSEKIIHLNQEIESLKKHSYSETLSIQSKDIEIEKKIEDVNHLIYKAFNLNAVERVLVNYAKYVVIPISMKHTGYDKLFQSISYENRYLNNYSKLYIERFKLKLDTIEKKFTVEIWHTNQIIGMFFKMIPANQYKQEITWVNKQNSDSEILSFLIKIGHKKITDRLFVQKDIRGFDRDHFYIFKPNEWRLWHTAIGYLDVNEFTDSILKTGRKVE